MTENVEISDCDKTIMNADEPIYGDLISEIDLQVVDETTNDKIKESLTEIVVEENTDLTDQNPELPTETESYVSSAILPQDDTVGEFFTVETKTEDFGNEMLIGEIDNESIEYKNETEVSECHEYDSKKIIFEECGEIVEVVNNTEVEVETEEVETEIETEVETEVAEVTEDTEVQEIVQEIEITEEIIPNLEETDDDNEKNKIELIETEVATVEVTNEDESLNRMHVMEDVEEGCDVSGALPASPGHAEQRPDPPKTTEIESPINDEQAPPKPAIQIESSVSPPTQNGICTENEKITIEVIEENHKEEPPVSPEAKEEIIIEKLENTEPEKVVEDTKVEEKIQLDENTKDVDNNNKKTTEDIAKDSSKEEEDSSSSENSQESSSSAMKRKHNEDECITPMKKLKVQIEKQYATHNKILSEYIEASNCNTIEEIQAHTEQLLAEIKTLNELAKEKEREWNNILHLKKVKEELLLRIQRKKHILLINSGDKNEMDWDISTDQQDDRANKETGAKSLNSGNLMMVPVVSSSPSISNKNARESYSKSDKMMNNKTRNILPKQTISDLNGQECRQGRQGPILDVRSIIADYRQRHPETVPRRGRRMKSVLNTHNDPKSSSSSSVLSMASLAFGSGSQVRHNAGDITGELGLLLSTMDSLQEHSRPSSADSSMPNNETMSFKDVLVQFAKLSRNERQELQDHAAASYAAAAAAAAASTSSKVPPPPYPEVTLHPVPSVPAAQGSAIPSTTQNQNNSLLHGILTKNQPRTENKPATFSPTLARLLTAPERVSNNNSQSVYTAALNSGVSISDLLSTGKSRHEITITPVGQVGQKITPPEQEILEGDEVEDNSDQLVIDEEEEVAEEVIEEDRNRAPADNTRDNGLDGNEDVPQCQGCNLKPAQFVCAGCGNQWYCSRDCQVAAWEEHSEICAG